MSHSRFLALPRSYVTSAGDPRGYAGASVAERTIFRYQTGWGNWPDGVPFIGDPVRVDGRPYITDVQMIPAAGIPDGTLLQVVDGFGGNDTFEFRADGNPPTPPNLLVDISADVTAGDVATSFFNAVNGIGTTNHITATIQPGDIVRLGQNDDWFGGRTGFSAAVTPGTFGTVAFQTLPAVFLVVMVQTGLDPVLVVPGWQGPRPVWLSVNAKPIFFVT